MIPIPNNFRGKSPDGAIEKALKAAEEEKETGEIKQVPQNLSNVPVITSFGTHWHIDDVLYRGEQYVADLSRTLLDSGAEHTQDEWAARYERAIDNNDFYTPDLPTLYGIVKALYTARGDASRAGQIAEAQEFLKSTSRAKWLMTLTRIAYQPIGDDIIIHNHGTRDRYENKVDFITSSECIKKTNRPTSYKALLGTQDSVQEINSVFHWISDRDIYAVVKPKPSVIERVARFLVNSKVIERVARLNASSYWAYLNCYWNPTYSNSSFGVRMRKKIFGAAP